MLLLRHLAIAAVAAIFLVWLRGGFRDEPSVFFFFGLIGFLASLAVSVVLRPTSQDWIDSRLDRLLRTRLVRHGVALVAVVLVFWLTAPLVLRAGYAGWLLFVALSLLFPLVVCLVAPTQPLAWALLTATVLVAGLWRYNLRRPWGDVPDPLSLVPEYFSMWMMAAVLAFLVALPRYLYLRSSSLLPSRRSAAARTT
jgi:hypothetical protein